MNDLTSKLRGPTDGHISTDRADRVDFLQSGAGPLVVLVHSSMAGAHQWSSLTRHLEARSEVRAVNLFGYGGTPKWGQVTAPTLDDFADLVAGIVPQSATNISLVGHSIGGAVAMQAAAHQLQGRVGRLVLIEPSLFYLLGRQPAFKEISMLARFTRQCIADGIPDAGAEGFIDYWCGLGTWASSSAERRAVFTRLVCQLPHEWAALLEGETTPAAWVEALPRRTLLMSSARTTRPSRQIVDLLLQASPNWEFANICNANHMAPLTHPQLVNALIKGFLTRWAAEGPTLG
jgi:pimeloyl-ACP methyl ester carboxylesterase